MVMQPALLPVADGRRSHLCPQRLWTLSQCRWMSLCSLARPTRSRRVSRKLCNLIRHQSLLWMKKKGNLAPGSSHGLAMVGASRSRDVVLLAVVFAASGASLTWIVVGAESLSNMNLKVMLHKTQTRGPLHGALRNTWTTTLTTSLFGPALRNPLVVPKTLGLQITSLPYSKCC